MKKLTLLLLLTAVSLTTQGKRLNDREIKAQQTQLDQLCDAARDKKLYPLRLQIRQECIDSGKAADFCTAEAGDYNGEQIGRKAKFYDLPECVTAFEFRKKNKR